MICLLSHRPIVVCMLHRLLKVILCRHHLGLMLRSHCHLHECLLLGIHALLLRLLKVLNILVILGVIVAHIVDGYDLRLVYDHIGVHYLLRESLGLGGLVVRVFLRSNCRWCYARGYIWLIIFLVTRFLHMPYILIQLGLFSLSLFLWSLLPIFFCWFLIIRGRARLRVWLIFISFALRWFLRALVIWASGPWQTPRWPWRVWWRLRTKIEFLKHLFTAILKLLLLDIALLDMRSMMHPQRIARLAHKLALDIMAPKFTLNFISIFIPLSASLPTLLLMFLFRVYRLQIFPAILALKHYFLSSMFFRQMYDHLVFVCKS